MADGKEEPLPEVDESGSLSLAERGLEGVPLDVAKQGGAAVKSLNLSGNTMKSWESLAEFTALDTLILDGNGLDGLEGCPKLPTVKTLWFNNNRVEDIQAFLDQVCERCPDLSYLSLMRNPGSPGFVDFTEDHESEYNRYRLYVIYRLPSLGFLDASPVSKEERAKAKVRGQFCLTKKPSQSRRSTAESAESKDPTASPSAAAEPAEPRKASSFLGVEGATYDGADSEGNRFISNADL